MLARRARAEDEFSRIERINAQSGPVPRRSSATLGTSEMRGVHVLSRVMEVAVLLHPATRHRGAVYVAHRTVLVRVDGEDRPRRIEYTRLSEFSREGGSGDD